MSRTLIEAELKELESAEEFLNHFGVPFDERVVQVNRLHILQRFHDYLDTARPTLPETADALRAAYKELLARAYQDFVESDAITERVFKVFQDVRGETFVPAEGLGLDLKKPCQE